MGEKTYKNITDSESISLYRALRAVYEDYLEGIDVSGNMEGRVRGVLDRIEAWFKAIDKENEW